MRKLIRRHPVLAYYLLAFAISWGAILVVVGPEGFVSTTAVSPTFALVGVASLLGPSMAGILVTGVVDGRSGLRELVARLARWRISAMWYGAAFGIGPLVMIAVLLALSLASRAFLPAILTAENKTSLLMLGVGTGVIVSVLEELGWTGLATPRLLSRHGVLAVGLIMGILWGAWHFPLFAGSANSSGEIPPALFLAAMLFAWLVPYRVLMVWVYDRTRSLLIAMVMHMPIVVSQYVLAPQEMSGEAGFAYLLAYGAALWLVVAVALTRRGRLAQPQPG